MSRLIALAFVVALPALLEAQLPVRVTRRGGPIEIATGEPVSFFLEHSKELELTEDQRRRMIEIRRRLRAVNAPYVRQLDSLRDVVGLSLEPTPTGRETRTDAIDRFTRLSAPVADSMRVNNDAARNEVWVLLSDFQKTKADSVAKAERDPSRRPPGPGGRRPPGG